VYRIKKGAGVFSIEIFLDFNVPLTELLVDYDYIYM
jgi:hypothetical protein